MARRRLRALAQVALVVFCVAPGTWAAEGPEPRPELKNPLVGDKPFVDVSFLNHKPAGKFGRVLVDGEHFRFEKGGKARFWGCNCTYGACFGDKKASEIEAARIAALGFNFVRLHHIDGEIVAGGNDSMHFNEKALDRLDYFIFCLKENGVYVYLDMHSDRELRPGDGIRNYDELKKLNVAGKSGLVFIDEDLQKNRMEWAKMLMQHVNKYTSLPYATDPCVVMVTLDNEQYCFAPKENMWKTPKYKELYVKEAEAFCKERGLNPADAVVANNPTSNALVSFLEIRYYKKAIQSLRDAGFRGAVVGDNWAACNGLMGVYPVACAGDYIDNHNYNYDPAWLGDLTNGGTTFVNILGGVRIAGKPFTASEWNTWGPHRASADLSVAFAAGHQGWDMLAMFAYSQGGGYGGMSQFDNYLDPSHMGINPAAAIAYRRDVTESTHNTVVVIDPVKDDIFGKGWTIWNMPAVSSSMEQTKTSIAFGKVPAELRNVTVITDPAKNLLLTKDNTVTSDTKEIFRNWEKGYQTLDTPRSQIAHGFIGGMPVQLSTVLIKAKAPYSAVAASSLTDEPIKESGRVLITGISTVRETGVGKAWGVRTQTGYISQTVGGTLTVTYAKKPKSVKFVPCMGNGTQGPASTLVVAADGSVTVNLDMMGDGEEKLQPTHWCILNAEW